MSVLHHTKGIVLKTVKYGETSMVVSIFTELFGLQQYMVNGVRSSKRNLYFSSSQFQSGNILDLVVYQNEKQTLQRIKECRYATQMHESQSNITKNAVLLYMMELLQLCLKQPDSNPPLFYFLEDVLSGLNQSTDAEAANLPLFFTIHLSHFFGFRLMDNFSVTSDCLDLREGQFVSTAPMHQMIVQMPLSEKIAQLLRVMQISELSEIKLNKIQRNQILDDLLQFYALHIHPFGQLRSLAVIRTVMDQ